MPNLDDELRRRMQRAGRRVGTDGLERRLHERRARKQITQKAGRGFLAVAVLAGSAVGVVGLNRAFRGDQEPSDATAGTVAFVRNVRPCLEVPDTGDVGGLELFTVDVATGEERNIPIRYEYPGDPGRSVSPQAPEFSPDGTKVAWRDYYTYAIFLTDVATGATHQLAPGIDALEPHWSPDGSTLLFSGIYTGSRDPDPLDVDGHYGIFTIAADGSSLTQLTDTGMLPTWTTDGRIAYIEQRTATASVGADGQVHGGQPGRMHFFVMNADGSGAEEVYDAPGDVPLLDAEWSPDGTKIVAEATLRGNTDIFVVDLALRTALRLTDDAAKDTSPSWSADGSQIAFHSGRWGTGVGHSEIAVMNADGSDVRRLTDDCWDDYDATWVKNDDVVRTLPTWEPPPRPDLGRAAVADPEDILVGGSEGGFADLYGLDPETGTLTNLTADYASQSSPAWSPDHSQIAFSGDVQEPGNYDIYVMNADGSDLRRLTTDPEYAGRPAWSPDGSTIAFEGQGGVWSVHGDGSDLRKVAGNQASGGYYPTWSPDGSRIAYSEGGTLFVVGADGTDPTVILRGSYGYELSWSPDGSRILFTCERDLCTVAPDGSDPVDLTEGDRDLYEREGDWSPDGSRIVFTREGELFVMAADGSDPRSLGMRAFCCGEPDW
jgi:Tol biopolymer transport system component